MVGSTGPAWCYCDVGGQLAGAVTLGAYPTLTPKQLGYILDHADAKVAFVEGLEEINKILARRDELTQLEKVVVWNTAGAESLMEVHDWLVPFERVLRTPVDRAAIEGRVAAVDPNSTAIIVYTSGTTGPPKGAMISHDNIMSVMRDQCRAELSPNGPRRRACLGLLRAHQHGHGHVLRVEHRQSSRRGRRSEADDLWQRAADLRKSVRQDHDHG
jgi:long-chain acyl-CoA synthetase